MFCKKCGMHLPDISKFCAGCGSKLENINSTNEPPKVNPKYKYESASNFTNPDKNEKYQNDSSLNNDSSSTNFDKKNVRAEYTPAFDNDHISEHKTNENYNALINNVKKLVSIAIVILIALVALFPFHYVIGYDRFLVFSKENLTFANTFITSNTVEKLIVRYNNANILDKFSIRNEYLFKKLMEKEIIKVKEENTDNRNNFWNQWGF